MDWKEFDKAITRADAAVAHAKDVRAAHRKRTTRGSEGRENDISMALARLKAAMAPIRSEIAKQSNPGRLIWEQWRELSSTSRAIQRERRKLWKMQERRELDRVKRGARR